MVKIPSLISGNIITIGVVLAGVALFFGLGGAQGIGAKIGGGFKGFSDSFVGALGGNIFGQALGEKPASEADPLVPPLSLTGQSPAIGIPQLNANLVATQGTLQGINNFFSNIFSGSAFNPNALTLPSLFTESAISTRIGQQTGAVPVSGVQSTGTFGGFTTASEQEIALQGAIVESREKNPSFFRL